MTTIINPSAGPIVYDEDGRSLGGGERREVSTLDAVGRRAVELGQLMSEEKAAPPKTEDRPSTAGERDDSGQKSARRGEKT